MYATLIVDDHLELYADGTLMGKGSNWHQGYVSDNYYYYYYKFCMFPKGLFDIQLQYTI